MAHPATLRAVRASIEALGVPLDIGAVFPKEGEERGYGIWQNRDLEPGEIHSLIPRLAAQNVRGGNIFMRLGPMASKAHPGLVLLDDLSANSVRRLSSAGFEPCLVTEPAELRGQAHFGRVDYTRIDPRFLESTQNQFGLTMIERDGAPEEIRTPDPQIRSLVLYPAELRAHPIGGLAPRQARTLIPGRAPWQDHQTQSLGPAW